MCAGLANPSAGVRTMIRGRVSRGLGSLLVRPYTAALRRGRVWSVPPWVWTSLPRSVKRWLIYRLWGPSEEFAYQLLCGAHELSPLKLPPANLFSLSSITRLVLHGLLERHQPRRIIELGSGVSTVIFASYLSRLGSVASQGALICSLDHDATWLNSTRVALAQAGLLESVRLIHAPLEEKVVDGRWTVTYGLSDDRVREVAGQRGFDLCFIDGPPRDVGRSPCLHLVAPHLVPGAVVLLDDGFRPGEMAAWGRWIRCFPRSLGRSRLLLTNRGLMMGRWLGKPTPAQGPEHALGSSPKAGRWCPPRPFGKAHTR
jgi:predicted O-methyltransferase YrrM